MVVSISLDGWPSLLMRGAPLVRTPVDYLVRLLRGLASLLFPTSSPRPGPPTRPPVRMPACPPARLSAHPHLADQVVHSEVGKLGSRPTGKQ